MKASSPDACDTVSHLLSELSARKQHTHILHGPGFRATGAELWADVKYKARAIAENGLKRQSRIGVLASNGIDGITAFMAAGEVGVCSPINPQLTAPEIHAYLDSMKIDLLVISTDASGQSVPIAEHIRWPSVRLAPPLADLARHGPWDLPEQHWVPPMPGDDCLLLTTSGTTSRPKAVALTHAQLMGSARNTAQGLCLSAEDLGLIVMPLFHIHGLVAGLLAPLSAQGSIYCASTKDPAVIADILDTQPVTWYTATPTIHQAIAESMVSDRPPRHRLRFVRSCSSALSPELLEELERTLSVPVAEAYGMTEASHEIACNPLPPAKRKPGSVGRPSGAIVRVVDDIRTPVPVNQVGAIEIKGPHVVGGYLENPRASGEAFLDGWFSTGDQGYIDDDGYLFLSGRTKELINRGGEKIWPREIDEVLARYPGVAKAVAFPVKHPRLGEDVAAAVVLRAGADVDVADLRRYASRFLASFKIPQTILVVPGLPTGPTGKLQRLGLADHFRLSGRLAGIGGDHASAAEHDSLAQPTQAKLASIWGETLGVAGVGADDNFFALGGDSLLAIRLIHRVNQEFGTQLSHLCIAVSGSTVSDMSGLVEQQLVVRLPELTATCSAEMQVDPAPQQVSLWLDQYIKPTSTVLNNVLAVELQGALRPEVLKAALDQVVSRHDALRARFPTKGGTPRLEVVPEQPMALDFLDPIELNQGQDATGHLPAYMETVGPLLDEPFDIAQGPLIRAFIARVRARQDVPVHLLVLIMHHLIGDEWSRSVICRDLLSLYEEMAGGDSANLPELKVQIRDIARWQAGRLAYKRESALKYWRDSFKDLRPYEPLPGDSPGGSSVDRARRLTVPVDRDFIVALNHRAAMLKSSVFELMLGCLSAELPQWLGVEKVAVGVTVSLRDHPYLVDQVGHYVSVVPVLLGGEDGDASAITHVVARYRAAVEHAELPLHEITGAVDRRPPSSRGPLFDVIVKKDVDIVQMPEMTDVRARVVPIQHPRPRGPLVIDLTDATASPRSRGRSELAIDYSVGLFTAGSVHAFASRLAAALERLAIS